MLYARAIARQMAIWPFEIHWFGRADPVATGFMRSLVADAPLFDYRRLGFHTFGGFLRRGSAYPADVSQRWGGLNLVFGPYEIHYGLEIIRRRFRVPWSRTGIIEDGIANYFPHTMMLRRWQPLKGMACFLRNGHFLTVSRHNLGGNPRVGIVTTLFPDGVYLAPGSGAQAIDIRRSVLNLLAEVVRPMPAAWRSASVILFLPPLLQYGRLREAEVAGFVEQTADRLDISSPSSLLVKPHPREDLRRLKAALRPLVKRGMMLADEAPMELYMRGLDIATWAGSPSTAMLNQYLLYPDRSTRFVLLPSLGSRHVSEQTRVLLRILGDRATLLASSDGTTARERTEIRD
ncbi:MAG: hypothetical protein ACRDJJ_01155 [Actinomycetota bacterium]